MTHILALLLCLSTSVYCADYSIVINNDTTSVIDANGDSKPDCSHITSNSCVIIIVKCDDKVRLYKLLHQLIENKCYPSIFKDTHNPENKISDGLAAYASVFVSAGKDAANSIYDNTDREHDDWITR